jgi:hypothetical protein
MKWYQLPALPYRHRHLLNPRFLGNEITEFSRKMFIGGEGLGLPLPPNHKLGLGRGAERQASESNPTLNHKFTSKLRQLVKDYGTLITYLNIYHRVVLTPPADEALIALNQVMTIIRWKLIFNHIYFHCRNSLFLPSESQRCLTKDEVSGTK